MIDFRESLFLEFFSYYIKKEKKVEDIKTIQASLNKNQNLRYQQLLSTTLENIDICILYITEKSIKWKFERIGSVEKICLILGVSELIMGLTKKDIVVSEWVKLTDKHSSSEGAKFVNGLLENIYKEFNNE